MSRPKNLLINLLLIVTVLLNTSGVALAAAGSIWTTDSAGNRVNQNLFASKAAVYLNGGPTGGGTNGLPDGDYYCQVLSPSGTVLGHSNTPTVVVSGGVMVHGYQLVDILYTAASGFITKGYDDTDNSGGEYKVEISMNLDFTDKKSDNFKVGPYTLPTVTLTKTVAPGTRPEPGGDFDYTITITNTSPTSVTITALTDSNAAGQAALASHTGDVLASGASLTVLYTVAYTDAGTYDNTASVTVTDPEGYTASASDSASCSVTDVMPQITVTKVANPLTLPEPGGEFTFTYVITNHSVESVTITSVIDDVIGSIALPSIIVLGPGESSAPMTGTKTYTTAGVYTNTVAAVAVDNEGNQATDTADASVSVTVGPAPLLSLVKVAAPTTYDAVGDTISYTYTVTNIGNVTITGPITVVDDKATVTVPPVTTLAPGASVTGTATYTIQQADLDAGSVDNSARAAGFYGEATIYSNYDDETVTAAQDPELTLVKAATPTTFDAVGDTISYTYTVTNTGNVTITGPITVVDDKATVTVPPVTSLAPGASVTGTATYTILQADLDAGSVHNTARAAGSYGDGTIYSNYDEETVTSAFEPSVSVTLTKTVSPTTRPEPGGTFTYTITITNTSNVEVMISELTDTNGAAAIELAPYLDTPLAAGQTITIIYSTTHTMAGTYDNTASVTVIDAQQTPASDSDTATCTVTGVTPQVAVDIQKTVSPSSRPEPGGSFGFTVTITNNSNVDVEITELTDTNTAGQTAMNSYLGDVMEPGDVITINYSVTHTGVGTYTNTAFVEVVEIEGERSDSDTDTATCRVYAEQDEPGTLTVIKLTNESQPLTGATFALYRGSTKLDERTLTGNTHKWNNLDAGTYTVVETSAPAGWVIRDASKTVSVSQGEDETVTFYNDPLARGSITVVKLVLNEADGTTSELNGVTFALYQPDTDGTLIDQRTLAGNEYTWSNLEPGDYMVVEVAAPNRPDGTPFEMADPVSVTVPAGQNVQVEIFNSVPLAATGSITVVKLVLNEADGTTSGMSGVTFALYRPDTNGTLLDQRTLVGNQYTWSNLEPGDYMVVEVAAPNRPDGTPFEMADPVSVTVPAGQNVRVEIFNSLPVTGAGYLPQFFAGLSMLGLGLAVRRRRVF